MQLVINTYGTYLHKVGDCFEVKVNDQKQQVSVHKIDSIMVTTGASLSTDAIELAMQHNIDLVFLDGFGNPYARVWQSKLGSTTLIRRKQLELAETEQGLALVIGWIKQKLDNQMEFLQELARHREPQQDYLSECCNKIATSGQKLDTLNGTIEDKRHDILGIEGSSGRTYFTALSELIPKRFQFNGRSRQPAKDEFNAMLNYSYGILYSLVEKACIIAGLDPYVGFLHTDNYNKMSLVFDLIEPYRAIGDQTVFYLFSKRQVKKEYFDEIKNGMTLNKEGKQVLIAAFNERMEKRIRYKGRNIQQKDVIQFDCHKLANQLIGKKQRKRE
ncbi:CRISPR-associated endonuclease Cas1 [candidate division KSB1 bacterium]|nr:CRISPR-associated endonuclease Cas1 [candidate division KSB1 bacterium]